ncbi:MAG: cupin domain-containing protein, partial [Gammaproteobacteria bacterium]
PITIDATSVFVGGNKMTLSMRQTALTLGLTSALGIALGVIGTQVTNAQQEDTVLLKTELAGIEGKEGTMFIHPGAASGKHSHPGDQFVYILEGSGTLEVEGKSPVSLEPGVTYYVAPQQVHEVKNASDSLKGVGVLIAEKGQPHLVPAK